MNAFISTGTTGTTAAAAVHPLYVHAQIVLHPKGFVADGAGIRPLAGVDDSMFAEGGAGDKALVAVVALVRAVAAVVAAVLDQRRIGGEGFGAGLTLQHA